MKHRFSVSTKPAAAQKFRFKGKSKKIYLGRFDPSQNGLARVRAKARAVQTDLMNARSDIDGVDPLEARRAAKAQKSLEAKRAAGDVVERVVRLFIDQHARIRNKRPEEAEDILNRYFVDRFTGRRLGEISSTEIRALILDITTSGKPIAANRALGRIKTLYKFAVEHEIVDSNPTERIQRLTSEKGRSRDHLIDDAEVGPIWRAAEAVGFPFGTIAHLLILTGCRKMEIGALNWGEVDLQKRIISIPKERIKNGLPHTVFLSDQAVSILAAMPRFERHPGDVDYVFSPYQRPPSGFSAAQARLVKFLDEPVRPFTWHDFRRLLSSTCARLGVQQAVTEKLLAHRGSLSGVAGTYMRYSFEVEQKVAVERYAAHIMDLVNGSPSDNVVLLRPGLS